MADGAVLWGLSWAEWESLAEILRNLALIGGVIGAGLALYFNYLRTTNDRRRLANDTFVKAVEQLGSDEMNVHLGAIYALERIAIEEQRYHWPIMETLSAYVRERAPWPPVDDGEAAMDEALREAFQPELEAASEGEAGEDDGGDTATNGPQRAPTDIQTVLTVIGRRPRQRREIRPWVWPVRYWAEKQADALEHRAGSDWKGRLWKAARTPFSLLAAESASREPATIDLRHTDLRHADMRGGALARAQFTNANLGKAHLEGANLSNAHLEGAMFSKEPKELGAA